MKLSMAGILAGAAICVVSSIAAQTTPSPATPAAPAAQADRQGQEHKGQVIFSRSTDENGEVTAQPCVAASEPGAKMAAEPSAEDAEREALTFTDFDMDLRLRTAEQYLAARVLVTVRNDGKAPLAHVPLQISSSLNWERISINGKDTTFPVATLNSDADHTGQLHEAAIKLAEPLAPGESVQLDVIYSGAIVPSAQRLLTIGTPEAVALHSDWDQIGPSFTGLRGFGNVVWYPVSSVPAILGDGARLFDEIGRHKLRMMGAHFRVRLTVEFPPGQAPTVALINGQAAALTIAGTSVPELSPSQTSNQAQDQSDQVPGLATASIEDAVLGFEAPSLFVAIRSQHSSATATSWTLPEDDSAVEAWDSAATLVTPFLRGWLGPKSRSKLTLLDLPDQQDAPFETGSLLATAIRPGNPQQLDGILAHALTHAYLHTPKSSPPAWLDEGVADFMGTLWVEKRSTREQALGALEASRPALALAEPESPGASAGQPLAAAISPVYYRTKAAYVLWMLRDIIGDPGLSAALRGYDQGTAPDASNARGTIEKLLEKAEDHHDLAWFFGDWVDADKGLPELSIDGVFPSAAQSGNWLVAVKVANNGYAAVEVPVTVRSESHSVTERLMVPARGSAVQRLLVQGKPVEVQVNNGAIPETQASVHVTKLDQTIDPTPAQPRP